MLYIAIDNSIGGGTGLPGSGGGGGGFTNEYSLDFDGVDDYISLDSVNFPNAISFSAWFKTTNTLTQTIWTALDSTIQKHFLRISNTQFRLRLTDSAGSLLTLDNALTSQDGNWHHVAFTTDGTTATDGVVVYFDGVALSNKGTLANNGLITTNKNNIGTYASTTWNFNGNIDELSLFNYKLSAEQISNIYNSGTPTDLTDLSPITWYRMGENGSYKSPQWLIPNNENKDKVSNYSFEFDGIDDYVDIGNAISFEYTDSFSYSFWINPNAVSGSDYLFSKYASGRGILMYLNSPGTGNNFLYFNLYNTNSGSTATRKRIVLRTGSVIPPSVWTNVVITYDGSGLASGITIYKNGVSQTITVVQDNLQNQTILTEQNAYISGNNFASSFYGGKQDEWAIFNTELSAAEALAIYNGGQPTTISGAVAYYKLSEEATFSGGVWTVPDQVGSNDGTSNAMTIEDRVGDAPSSENNGLSYNMDEVDRKKDTPPTPSFTNTYSLEFDGVDNYVSVSDNSIGQTQNISYSIWVNLDVTTRQYIIGNQNSSNGGCGLQIESGDVLVFQMADGGNDSFFNSRVANFSTYAPINTWNHILATWDGTDAKIYINGVLRNTWSPTLPYTISGYDTTFNIGWRAAGFAQMTNGKLDELALFDSAISIGDVWDGSGQPTDLNLLSTPPLSWWRFEEGSGTTATDSGSSGNNGTLENSPTYSTDVPT